MSLNGFMYFLVITFQDLSKRHKDKRTDREALLEKQVALAKEQEKLLKKRIMDLENKNRKLKREAKQHKAGTSKYCHKQTFHVGRARRSRKPISSTVAKYGTRIKNPRGNEELSRKSQPQENETSCESTEGSDMVEDTRGDSDDKSDDSNGDLHP